MSDLNYYEILGVSKSSSQDEIKKAYRNLLKKYHPDVFKGDKEVAEKKSALFNEAYDILGDATKRKEYDLKLEEANKETTYEFTPPKYTSNSNNETENYNTYTSTSSYNNYNNNNANNYTRSGYNPFYKTSYNTYKYNNYYSNTSISNEDKVKRLLKFFLIMISVIILYAILLTTTLIKLNNMKNNNSSNYTNYEEDLNKSNSYTNNNDASNILDDNSKVNTELNYKHNTNLFLYNFFTESQVETLYARYGSTYDSFSSFEAYLNKYITNYYNSYLQEAENAVDEDGLFGN